MKLNQIKIKKKLIKDFIFKTFEINKNLINVSIVGSFINNKSILNISDIDIILILKKIDKNLFDKINQNILARFKKSRELNKFNLLINNSFGPLKFYKKKTIVFHVMLYDVQKHIDHVIKSPFTCYDWERSEVYRGRSLKKIFPVGCLQLCDFIKNRRSIKNYINDLNDKSLSYQSYYFKNNQVYVKKKKTQVNEKKYW